MEVYNTSEVNEVYGKDRAITHAAEQLEVYLTETRDADTRILRDKQVDVMDDLHQFLLTHAEQPYGYISLPTGVGKTVLFTELVKATNLKTLILTPTQGLLDQTEEAFQRFGDQTTVGKVYANEKNSSERITLSTYASFVRHNKTGSSLIAPGMFDLIILDEAHRALAAETKCSLARYGDSIQIGFTATEDYSDTRKLESLLPAEIHKMTIREAIEHKLITPFNNILVKTGVSMSNVRITATNEYDSNDLEQALNTDARNETVLKMYQQHFSDKKVIMFCNGVEHAKAVADTFNNAGISAMAIHGGLSFDTQVTAKAGFASDGVDSISVLTNDKILAEGFDVPAASACFNLTPTLSRVRAQQRGGRVLRLDPQNPDKIATVVDFLDESYPKPPVLFSDPRVAEHAQIGVTTTDGELLKGFNEDDINVITNPQLITEMAQKFYESHKVEKRYAPDGWLSAGQIGAIYDMEQYVIFNGVSNIIRDDDELCKTFNVRYARSKTKRQYFHPEVVKELARVHGHIHADLDISPPIGWVNRETFESQYPTKVLKSIYSHSERAYTTTWMNHSIVTENDTFYGPKLLEILTKLTQPDKHWMSIKPLIQTYNVDEIDIDKLVDVLARRDRQLAGGYPLWCFVDGKEEMYLVPRIYGSVSAELSKQLSQQQQPQQLNENETVSIRNPSEQTTFNQLARLFENKYDSRATSNVAPDRRKKLDALYAEFL